MEPLPGIFTIEFDGSTVRARGTSTHEIALADCTVVTCRRRRVELRPRHVGFVLGAAAVVTVLPLALAIPIASVGGLALVLALAVRNLRGRSILVLGTPTRRYQFDMPTRERGLARAILEAHRRAARPLPVARVVAR